MCLGLNNSDPCNLSGANSFASSSAVSQRLTSVDILRGRTVSHTFCAAIVDPTALPNQYGSITLRLVSIFMVFQLVVPSLYQYSDHVLAAAAAIMGLAAKMAAAGGAYAVGTAGADQYQQHQQTGVPPAQIPGQYGAPPPGQYGATPPGQYGAPPPGQYGAPAPPQQQQDGSALAGIISQKLQAIVAANGLQPLFPAAALDHVIRRAQGVDFRALAAKYNMPGGHNTSPIHGP